MRVVVVPRDPNPYQELLHGELRRLGVDVCYLEGPTRSQTVNLMLRPLLLLAWRIRGAHVLHIHWVYDFAPAWTHRSDTGRRVAQWWFVACLWIARRIGLRVVWTAHNVVPHERTFYDDLAGRRSLLQSAAAVLVHSPATADRIRQLGEAVEAKVTVIPQGDYRVGRPQALSMEPADRQRARASMDLPDSARVLVHFGVLRPYKGVHRLLSPELALDSNVVVAIAGACDDPIYRHQLESLAARAGPQVRLSVGRLSDTELATCLAAADLAIFPFVEVTNSSSVLLALAAGVPVVVPDLPEFGQLPCAAVLRFPNTEDGLAAALGAGSRLDANQLAAMSAHASAAVSEGSWESAAAGTVAAYRPALPAGVGA